MRYETMQECAPYIGMVWDRRFGATADLARAAGQDAEETVFVAGLRLWY